MILRKVLTRKAVDIVESVAEPAKKAVQDQINIMKSNVGDRSDWGAKVAKFGLAVLMLLITFREDKTILQKQEQTPLIPSTITINNYVNDMRERSNDE